eukprot:g60854.t1
MEHYQHLAIRSHHDEHQSYVCEADLEGRVHVVFSMLSTGFFRRILPQITNHPSVKHLDLWVVENHSPRAGYWTMGRKQGQVPLDLVTFLDTQRNQGHPPPKLSNGARRFLENIGFNITPFHCGQHKIFGEHWLIFTFPIERLSCVSEGIEARKQEENAGKYNEKKTHKAKIENLKTARFSPRRDAKGDATHPGETRKSACQEICQQPS